MSVSLALALVAILSLGGGMAFAQSPINVTNSSGNVTIDSGSVIEGTTGLGSFATDLDTGYVNATGNVSILNQSLSNVSNLTAGENILLDANYDTIRDTIGINNTAGTDGNVSAGGTLTIKDTNLVAVEGEVNITAADDIILSGGVINETGGTFGEIVTDGGIVADNGSIINITTGNISANTSILIDGASTINATNINVTDGGLDVLNSSTLESRGNVTANTSILVQDSKLNVSENLVATKGSIDLINATVNVTNDILANTTLTIEKGTIEAGNLTSNYGDIIITDIGDAVVTNNVTAANGTINISGSNLSAGNITATKGAINITGSDNVLVTTGVISANTSVFITDSVNVSATNITTTENDVKISNVANLTLAGNITAGDSISIEGSKLNVTSGSSNITAAGNIVISDSQVINFSTAPTLTTGINGSLTISGASTIVNVSQIYNNNGTINIQNGKNYLGNITGVRTNVTISGGNNTIENLVISENTTTSPAFGNVSFSGGNNTVANVTLTNASLYLSGNSNNTFTENITIVNGSFISSAAFNKINVSGNFSVTNGTIQFTGGTTTFADTIEIYLDGSTAGVNYTLVSNGAKVVLANQASVNFSALNSGIVIGDGGTLFADGAINEIIQGNVSVEPYGTLDVGVSELFVDDGVYFADNSTFAVGYNGTTLGLLSAPVWYGEKVLVNFTNTTDLSVYEGLQITNGSVTNLTPDSFFYNPFFETIEPFSGGNNLTVGIYVGAGGAIKNIADAGGFKYTRNMQSSAGLIDRILYDGASAAPSSALANLKNELIGVLTNGYYGALYGEGSLVEMILRASIGESILGVKNAVVSTAFKANSVVLGRLDKIHTADLKTPPAAGEGLLNRVWVGGFGSWAKQDDTDDIAGYKYHSGGFALGYDRTFDGVPGLVLGISTAFSFGEVENNYNFGKIDTDTASIGVYGSYKLDSGLFFDATLAYGHSENDSSINVPLYGRKSGSFDIDTWQFGVRSGWVLKAGSFDITPSIGLRYLHLKQDDWAEKGTAPIRNFFKSRNDDLVDIPVQVKFSTTIESATVKVTPELRLGWTYAAEELDNKVEMGFVGYRGTTPIWGIKQERSSFQVGAGVKIAVSDTLDVFANYDVDLSKDYYNHQASVGIGFEF
ncbi:MAG: autotransporter domain-containing protein [Deltaproteobacteria bacterium]|nr:autotransporter domain-containing protein [Deltaproteobacteria bacterium]